MSTQSGHDAVEQHRERTTVETDDEHDAEAIDRTEARTAAIALAVWLTLTFVAIGMLLVFGDAISALFV